MTLHAEDHGPLLNAIVEVLDDTKWQLIGQLKQLTRQKCWKFYALPDEEEDDGVQVDDVAVFVLSVSEIYAMDCACPHEGGPLELGDIEDVVGEPAVICPWHGYDFNLRTGASETGLRTNTYEVRIADDENVFVKIGNKLSLTKPSECSVTDDVVSTMGNLAVTDDDSISCWAQRILLTAEPMRKVELTNKFAERWSTCSSVCVGDHIMPEQPLRAENLNIVASSKMKSGGKGGSLSSRIAILHALANIEQWAIDLSWDIVGRFGGSHIACGETMPKEFFDDFIRVATEEAKHFSLIETRLRELGSYFGALPVHNGLWQSAQETSTSLLARLAIVHMVHEARGLDVHPKTRERFEKQRDHASTELMDVIYRDEITHVSTGMRWFLYVCQHSVPALDPVPTFHSLVRKHFKGYLKPPFNTSGRATAGMKEEWYSPLVKPSTPSAGNQGTVDIT